MALQFAARRRCYRRTKNCAGRQASAIPSARHVTMPRAAALPAYLCAHKTERMSLLQIYMVWMRLEGSWSQERGAYLESIVHVAPAQLQHAVRQTRVVMQIYDLLMMNYVEDDDAMFRWGRRLTTSNNMLAYALKSAHFTGTTHQCCSGSITTLLVLDASGLQKHGYHTYNELACLCGIPIHLTWCHVLAALCSHMPQTMQTAWANK